MDAAQSFEYQTGEELGRGPLAVVYRARAANNGQELALKVTRPGLVQDASLYARLSREAEALSLLQQPGILTAASVTEQGGQLQIAMPLMTGGSLQARLEAGPLPLESALRLVERLAPALDAAHAAGFLHLDIKPANVLFDEENQAWLSDFGAHKLAQACLEPGPFTLYGPLAYASPEQLGAGELDERADVYALGALLYHMLCGEPPYLAGSALGYLAQHRSAALPPLPERLPGWLHPVLAKAMAHDPRLRYLSAGALADDLRRGLESAAGAQPAQDGAQAGPASSAAFRPPPPAPEAAAQRLPESGDKSARKKRQPALAWLWLALLLAALAAGAVLLPRLIPGAPDLLALVPLHTAVTAVGEAAATPAEQPALAPTATASAPAAPTRPPATPALPSSTPAQAEVLAPTGALPATQPPATQPPATAPPPTLAAAVPLTYTIQYNDTLFTIAASYNLDLSYLIAINDLNCDSRLYPRKEIKLPPPSQDEFPTDLQAISTGNFSSLRWERILECVRSVRDLSFSPDGGTLAVAQDNFIYLWTVGEWTPRQRLKGHLSKISSITYSPDGRLLASAADDRKIRLWSTEDGSELLAFNAHGNEIKNIAFSPDGKLLVSTSTDQTVKIWDAASGKLLHQLRGYKAYGAAWSPDGSLLAIGYGESLRVYQTSDYSQLFSLPSPDETVHELAFSPDGSLLASGSDVWHVAERKHVFHLQDSGHTVLFTQDGRLLLTGAQGWQLSNGATLGKLKSPLEETPRTQYAWESVALSPDGSLLAWGSQDGLSIWGTGKPAPPPDPNLYAARSGDTYFNIAEQFHLGLRDFLGANDLSCSHVIYTGQPLNVAGANVETMSLMQRQVFSPGTASTLAALSNLPDPTCARETGVLSFSPDGLSLASGGSLWRLTRNSLLLLETDISFQSELAEGVRVASPAIVFSPAGDLAAVRSGSLVRLYDLASGRLVRTLEGHSDKVAGLAFSPDGSLLASGSSTVEKAIHLWNVADGSLVRTIPGVAAKNLSFSYDGQILMSAWEDDTIRFWNVADGLRLRPPLSGIMGRAVFSPDGQSIAYIACAEKSGVRCKQQVVNLYRLEDGVIYRTLPGLKDLVQEVIWSPDGMHVLVASEYAVLEWDVETSALVRKFDPPSAQRRTVERLYLTPNNSYLLAVADDDTIYFWDYAAGSLEFVRRIEHEYLAFSPLDNLLAFYFDGRVSLWGLP